MMSVASAEDAFDLHGSTMTGDWNGTRTEWAEKGIKFDGTIAMDGSYLADGGYDAHQAPTFATQFGLGTTLDMTKLAGWSDVTIRALVTARQGESTSLRGIQAPDAPQWETLKPTGDEAERCTYGGWIAFEQQLTSVGEGKRGLHSFGNFTVHDRTTTAVSDSQQLGLKYYGLFESQPNDILGLAVNRVHLNDRYTDYVNNSRLGTNLRQLNEDAEIPPGGSNNKGRADIVLQGGADKANEPSYVISSSYFDTDGYRDHSAARKTLSNAKLTWDLDDGSKINWITNYVNIHADDPQGLSRDQWKQNPKQVNDSKELLPNTRISLGLAYDAMNEDRQGYENFDANGQYGVKGKLRRDERNTLWNLDLILDAFGKFLPNHYVKYDADPKKNNGDDSGQTDYTQNYLLSCLNGKLR
ncbi:hypothetical protein FQR65_LT16843 [Abscondita terminalis]|nr:hypothetical protein FQR65_LT16843 [Abscondita terminalis]